MDNVLKWISITGRFTKMYLDKKLEEFDINSSQHIFLKKICEKEGITQDELYSCIFVNKSNITRAIIQLEQKGYIIRVQNDCDRRSLRLYTTDKAKKIYREIQEIEKNWISIILDNIDNDKRTEFEETIKKVAKNSIDYLGKNKEEFDEKN